MDKILEELLKKANATGNIHVIKVESDKIKNVEEGCEDVPTEIISESHRIAKANKVLYDAHIEVGFTEEQAIQLVSAIIEG